jgi:hypothetical protein
MVDGMRNVTGRLEDKDGVNPIRNGKNAKGDWILYGGSITVDGNKYSLKAGFNDEGKEKLEEMLGGLMVNDTVNLTIEINDKGYDEVTIIEVKNPRVDPNVKVTSFANTTLGKNMANEVQHIVVKCTFEELEDTLHKMGTEHKIFATQPLYRNKHDDFVLIGYYKE